MSRFTFCRKYLISAMAAVPAFVSATAQAQVTYAVLHSFNGNDGANAEARLVQGPDGTLYGTTANGGSTGNGTIFQIGPDSSGFTLLHSFTGPVVTGLRDGLIQGPDGTLYGTTQNGGSVGVGTIFQMSPDGSGFTLLHSFAGPDGAAPAGGLIQGPDGTLYGTTLRGGSVNDGTVFQMAPDGSGFTLLHTFSGTGSDGAAPSGGLIQGPDGTLYGATYLGGSVNGGTVFQLAPDGSGFTLLHDFTGTGGDSASPVGGLIQGPDGTLYGTTSNVGGTVFQMAPDGSGFTLLHTFTGPDGAYPLASLIQGPDGTLYGTTDEGGMSVGVVFGLTVGSHQRPGRAIWDR